MKRRLFTAASVLSLLLSVATVVLWVLSALRPDGYYVAFSRGEISVCASRGWIVYEGPPRTMNRYVMAAAGASAQGVLMPGPTIALFRCWKVALTGLALPAIALILRPRSTRKTGYCVRCGYDLRASKDRCPECGTAISVKQQSDIASN